MSVSLRCSTGSFSVRVPQVQYEEEEEAEPVTFCQRVSAEQYDRERRGTSGSLLSLLDTIITDTAMSRKDKIKRLRQVRATNVPHVAHRCRSISRDIPFRRARKGFETAVVVRDEFMMHQIGLR